MAHRQQTVTCEIVEHGETLSLAQLCRSAGVHAEWVMLLVEQGILEPVTPRSRQWQFATTQLPRLHIACRLAHDLELNASGIALALELLDEIHTLQARLDAHERPPKR
jgi:chaperone modulatory protein CbpM